MKQPIKNSGNKVIRKAVKKESNNKNKPCRYGTSNLEVLFMKNFLDYLGIEYVYQKEFQTLRRVFDFYLPKQNVIIEVNGGFFHGDPRFYAPDKLNNMQKKNKRVDEKKKYWADLNCIPLIYIWEYDIHNNPDMVLNLLRERILGGNVTGKKIIK